MKKFFNFSELGSCCRPQATEEGGGHEPAAAPAAKRGGRCSAGGQWRPGLPAISEDGVVAAIVVEQQVEGKSTNPTARRRPPSRGVGSTAKNRSYNTTNGGGSKDEFRANSIPVIIPAFSPTPFVF